MKRTMNDQTIYKIVSTDEWAPARESGRFGGAAIDLADGYIHFSTASQVAETLHKHFAGQDNLLLIGIDPAPLGEALVYEPSRGGDLFPHLYGELDLEAVLFERAIARDGEGHHSLPDLAP